MKFLRRAAPPKSSTSSQTDARAARFDTILHPDPLGPMPPHNWTDEMTMAIIGREAPLVTEFMRNRARASYNSGVWRFFLPAQANFDYWTSGSAWARDWPEFAGIRFFGVDWLGRLVGVDRRPGRPSGSEVVRLEPGYGELALPDGTVEDFIFGHLIEGYNDTLTAGFYEQWLAGRSGGLAPEQCLGYRRPPILGGDDDLDNLEVIDLQVYVSISGQLVSQTSSIPDGAVVDGVDRTLG